MSRSESPLDDDRSAPQADSRSPSRQRQDDASEQPAKRMRTDTKVEDKARSKRLFGNLLGTLQQFKKDDKNARTSAAAKKREEISERIASKIRTETSLHHDIVEAERELKSLRVSTDHAEVVVRHKEAAMSARHAALRPISKFLYTAPPPPTSLQFEITLVNPPPIPLASGPSRIPPPASQPKPLYFLPKVLLPHQESELETRIKNIEELINEEEQKLVEEKEKTSETSRRNRSRVEELVEKLAELKKKVKPSDLEKARDDFGRTPREEMDVDRDASREKSPRRDREEISIRREREEVGQIRGEDGDVDVEY